MRSGKITCWWWLSRTPAVARDIGAAGCARGRPGRPARLRGLEAKPDATSNQTTAPSNQTTGGVVSMDRQPRSPTLSGAPPVRTARAAHGSAQDVPRLRELSGL